MHAQIFVLCIVSLDSTLQRSHRRGAETLRNREKLGVQEQELNLICHICDEVEEGADKTQNSFRTLRLRASAVRISVTSRLGKVARREVGMEIGR
jgi:hypothetical protein